MVKQSGRNNRGIGRRAAEDLALILAISLLAGATIYRIGVNASKQSELIVGTLQMQLSLERLLSSLKDAETGQRGYLLTGSQDYLPPYEVAPIMVRKEISELEVLTTGNAKQHARVEELQALCNEKLAELAKTIELDRRNGTAAAIDLVRTNEGRRIMERIRAVWKELDNEQTRTFTEQRRALGAANRQLVILFLSGYGFMIFMIVFLNRDVRRYSRKTEAAESELRAVNSQLEQTVEHRTVSLRESEERLRLAQEAAHVASWDWDVEGDRLCGSPGFARLFDFVPDEAIRLSDWLKKLQPEDGEVLNNAIANWSAGVEDAEAEFRIRGTDGKLRWHLVKGARVPHAKQNAPRVLGVIIDITHRKESEARLEAAEELHRMFVKCVPAAVAMLDRNLRYLEVSDRWSETYRVRSSEALGRGLRDLFPNLPERWHEVYRRCLSGQRSRGDEDLIERPDGTSIWIRWEMRPWGPAEDEPQGVLVFTEDVTEYRRMETQLRIRTDALDHSLTAFCILDANATITYANQTCLQMWGYDRLEEVLARPALIPGLDSTIADVIANDLARNDRFTTEFTARRRDGSSFDVLMTIQASVDVEGNPNYICAALDITARKQAEEALKESEATIRALLETASHAILAVDDKQEIVMANRMAEQIFGYRQQELINTGIAVLLCRPSEGRCEDSKSQSNPLVWINETSEPIELRGRRLDCSEFPAEVCVSHLETRKGALALCFIADITARKQSERALRESEQELRALTGNLLTAQEDERRRIARDLHDDVTQELASICIDLGTMAATMPAPDKDLTGRLRYVQRRVAQVSNVVRHVSHGLHPSILEDLGLAPALEVFCQEFSQMEGIPVRFVSHLGDVRVGMTAASCLYRIAQESLRNATKHARAKHIDVELKRDQETLQLAVRDDGLGLDITGNRRTKIGLGLVNMKERMRLVNGNIMVHSQPGQGTHILASIPLKELDRETIADSGGG